MVGQLMTQKSQVSGTGAGSFAKSDGKDRKIGHRRVDDAGQVTYKKVGDFVLPSGLKNWFEKTSRLFRFFKKTL